MRLYRPVGYRELVLIAGAGGRAFPPRLSWQPIFYPVLNFAYAAQIASEWNTVDEASDYAGFVTQFDVEDEFVSRYEPKQVGGAAHMELWVPAEELDDFNRHIQGSISVCENGVFYGERWSACAIDEASQLPVSYLSRLT